MVQTWDGGLWIEYPRGMRRGKLSLSRASACDVLGWLRCFGRLQQLNLGQSDAHRPCVRKWCYNVSQMKKASIRDLRYSFKKIERLLRQGEEIQITKRGQVLARLVPENTNRANVTMPDFLGRLRTTYRDKVLTITGAELVAKDRSRY
jgi:antitoxin (DNA-binding transcriptional repressor) of toxin-antitoxin stability system